ALSAVGREVTAHGKPEDLVGAPRQRARMVGIERYERFALRAAFVRDIHVGPHADRRRRTGSGIRSVVEDELVLAPPGGVLGIVRLGDNRTGQAENQAAEPEKPFGHEILLENSVPTRDSISGRASWIYPVCRPGWYALCA